MLIKLRPAVTLSSEFKYWSRLAHVMTRLLVSAKDFEEVDLLYEIEGVDIVDLKDVTDRDSLGCPDVELIVYAVERKPPDKEVSVPLGDLPGYTSCVKLCARVVDMLGVDYVKVGLAMRDPEEALEVARTLQSSVASAKTVLVGFADWEVIGSLSPFTVAEIARKTDVPYIMVDTKLKQRGRTVLDYLPITILRQLVEHAHAHGLKVAVAGGLTIDLVQKLLSEVKIDVIGIRTGVCAGSRDGRIVPELVEKLVEVVKLRSCSPVAPQLA